ncbi:MAG: hypothetical protein JSR91_02235 [Proteobacteria bacterium]|nr:hypothetical protein [Pseudomonadota bacterium]
MRRVLLVILSAGMLAACADPVKPIHAWSRQTAAAASIGTVKIVNHSTNATEENLGVLKSMLEGRLAECAKGPSKYEMQVVVDNYKLANYAAVMLIGDQHEISANIKMVDPVSQDVAGEYYVQETIAGGGLIGMAKLSGGARSISSDFASSVCKRIFLMKA